MVLDKEEDRQILLEFIRTSTIKGEAVFTVVDLIARIQAATVAGPEGAAEQKDAAPSSSQGAK